MDVIKFRNDMMMYGTPKRTLIYGMLDLNSDLWCDKLNSDLWCNYKLSHWRVISSLVQITQNN